MEKKVLKRTIKKNVYIMNYDMFIKLLNNKKQFTTKASKQDEHDK